MFHVNNHLTLQSLKIEGNDSVNSATNQGNGLEVNMIVNNTKYGTAPNTFEIQEFASGLARKGISVFIDTKGDSITYPMRDQDWDNSGIEMTNIEATAMDQEKSWYIQSVLERLGEILAIDFSVTTDIEEVENISKDFHVNILLHDGYIYDQTNNWTPGSSTQFFSWGATPDEGEARSGSIEYYISINESLETFDNGNYGTLTEGYQAEILRQIGNALCLESPLTSTDGDVVDSSEDISVDQTVMASGEPTQTYPEWFQEIDIDALKSIYGAATEAPLLITGPSTNKGAIVSSLRIKENTNVIHLFSADYGPVNWQLDGGEDVDLFEINRTTGALSFKQAPEYDSPQDNSRNNIYEVYIKAVDASDANNTSNQKIIVKIDAEDHGNNGIDDGSGTFAITIKDETGQVVTESDNLSRSQVLTAGRVLSAAQSTRDPDGLQGEVSYTWQIKKEEHSEWINAGSIGKTFTVPVSKSGYQIQVLATYTDGEGKREEVSTNVGVIDEGPAFEIHHLINNSLSSDNKTHKHELAESSSRDGISVFIDAKGALTTYPGPDGVMDADAIEMDPYKEWFIQSTLARLSDILDFEITYTSDIEQVETIRKDYHINIMNHTTSLFRHSDAVPDYGGIAKYVFETEYQGNGLSKVITNVDISLSLSSNEAYTGEPSTPRSMGVQTGTVLHELGHALMLDHPFDIDDDDIYGTDLDPTTDESLMSYGAGTPEGIKKGHHWYTDLDIRALKSIHGVSNSLPPLITGPSGYPAAFISEVSTIENNHNVHTFSADSEDVNVRWEVEEAEFDGDLFEIKSTTGLLKFKQAPTYIKSSQQTETRDNNYDVKVRATDSAGNSTWQKCTISVIAETEKNNRRNDGSATFGFSLKDENGNNSIDLLSGHTLTVSQNSKDPDDQQGEVIYTWKTRVDNNSEWANTGTTGPVFTISESSNDQQLQVTASYTDGESRAESVSTDAGIIGGSLELGQYHLIPSSVSSSGTYSEEFYKDAARDGISFFIDSEGVSTTFLDEGFDDGLISAEALSMNEDTNLFIQSTLDRLSSELDVEIIYTNDKEEAIATKKDFHVEIMLHESSLFGYDYSRYTTRSTTNSKGYEDDGYMDVNQRGFISLVNENINNPSLTGGEEAKKTEIIRAIGHILQLESPNNEYDGDSYGDWDFPSVDKTVMAYGEPSATYPTWFKELDLEALKTIYGEDQPITSPTTLALKPSSDSGNSNSDNLTNISNPTITGRAEPGRSITVFADASALGNTSAEATSGEWSFTVSTDSAFADGNYQITATASDSSGNTSVASDSLMLSIDTTAPTISSAESASPLRENSGAGQQAYLATATDASAVMFALKQNNNDDASDFSINSTSGEVTLTENPNRETKENYGFTLVATDVVGNSSEQNISLMILNSDEDQTNSGLMLPKPGRKKQKIKLSSPYTIKGLSINSVLIGTGKSDQLKGTKKSDLITGHLKKDTLSGGKGNKGDIFLLSEEQLGKKHADIIIGFNGKQGDLIALDIAAFLKGSKTKLKAASNLKKLNKLAKKSNELIYDKKKGDLYFNENGKAKGLGRDGGLLATLKGAPKLNKKQFTYLDFLESADGGYTITDWF